MADEQKTLERRSEEAMVHDVAGKERRRLRAKRARQDSVWFGLGLFGVVGWSVALPTLLLTALGVYVDRRFPGQYSWTLMLLVLGVALGCWNAWYWIRGERKTIERESEGDEGSRSR